MNSINAARAADAANHGSRNRASSFSSKHHLSSVRNRFLHGQSSMHLFHDLLSRRTIAGQLAAENWEWLLANSRGQQEVVFRETDEILHQTWLARRVVRPTDLESLENGLGNSERRLPSSMRFHHPSQLPFSDRRRRATRSFPTWYGLSMAWRKRLAGRLVIRCSNNLVRPDRGSSRCVSLYQVDRDHRRPWWNPLGDSADPRPGCVDQHFASSVFRRARCLDVSHHAIVVDFRREQFRWASDFSPDRFRGSHDSSSQRGIIRLRVGVLENSL